MKTTFLKLMAVAALLILFSGCKQEPKVLTVYFSHWGNTKILADMIHESVGGDIFVIETEEAYPQEGTHAAVQKQLDEGVLPALKGKVENLKSYDVVFIGTPNWFNTMALPVKVFLQENDLKGKKIVPFATYGGSAGTCLADIEGLCPGSTALTGFAVSGDDVKNKKDEVKANMEEWLNGIKPSFK